MHPNVTLRVLCLVALSVAVLLVSNAAKSVTSLTAAQGVPALSNARQASRLSSMHPVSRIGPPPRVFPIARARRVDARLPRPAPARIRVEPPPSLTYTGKLSVRADTPAPRNKDELALLRWRWLEPLPTPVSWPGEWHGSHVSAFSEARKTSAPCPNQSSPLLTWSEGKLRAAKLATNAQLREMDSLNSDAARRSYCRTIDGQQTMMPYELRPREGLMSPAAPLRTIYGGLGEQSRYPYWPFVSGDAFRYRCEHRCEDGGCTFAAVDVQAGDCIFIGTTILNARTEDDGMRTMPGFLDAFNAIRAQITNPYIIVTHNGDLSTPDGDEWHQNEDAKAIAQKHWERTDFSSWLRHDRNLLGWFAQNCNWRRDLPRPPKLHCIPIGLQNRAFGHASRLPFGDVMVRVQPIRACWGAKGIGHCAGGGVIPTFKPTGLEGEEDPHRILLLGFGVDPDQHKPDRTLIARAFRDSWPTRLPWGQAADVVRKLIVGHMFVACPHGHGYDTHRLWTVLLSGGFPLVRASPLDTMYDGLPVLIVDEWEDATKELLLAKYAEFMARNDWKMDRMYMPYWDYRMRLVQGRTTPEEEVQRGALGATIT